jgi:hypothetical protein
MGLWSEQRKDNTKMLVAAGRARQLHQQCKSKHKKRDHRSDPRIFSWYLGAFTLFLNGDALCQSKPVL